MSSQNYIPCIILCNDDSVVEAAPEPEAVTLSHLQALTGSGASSAPNQQTGNSSGGAPTKKPKTIHRCILQRVSRNAGKGPNGAGGGGSAALKCHVCDSSYVSYERYYAHLMDSTCAKREGRTKFSA